MKALKLHLWLKVSAAAVAMASAGAAMAQDQAGQTNQADQAANDDPLGTIIVTAEKHDENLQNTAISITALSASDLQSRAITNPEDLEGHIPAVHFQPNGDLFVTIRGIGTFNLQPGVDSAVAYTVDGNYVAHPAELPTLLSDLDHGITASFRRSSGRPGGRPTIPG